MSTEVTPNVQCATIGCEKAASKLRCPTCLKRMGLSVYFCSQQCFKGFWSIHKMSHTQQQSSKKVTDPKLRIPAFFQGFRFTGDLRPAMYSKRRLVPDHIERPDYAETGIPEGERRVMGKNHIVVHTLRQVEKIRKVCRLAREVLDLIGEAIKPGVTTDQLDEICHNACIERNAYPSPLNYRGFPKSCCTSVNEVVCHGIPDYRPLEEGDIVNVDVTLYHDGYHGDMNETFFVGKVDDQSERLVRLTYEALEKAIKECVAPGKLYRNIGNNIMKFANKQHGLGVVRTYCGHGIGALFHTMPNVPHYARNKAVGVMKPGHVFTIEPMINLGSYKEKTWPDRWTSVTVDGKRSAQFEHTMVVTKTGVEVLTGRIPGKKYDHPFYVPSSERNNSSSSSSSTNEGNEGNNSSSSSSSTNSTNEGNNSSSSSSSSTNSTNEANNSSSSK